MLKLATRVFLILAVGTAMSCGSKKKVDESADSQQGMDSAIASSDITLDPMGSDSGNISGLTTINFDYDDSSLTSQARQALANNADWVKKNPGLTIQIEGHCDDRGSVEYNLALGERRAKSVKNYLVSLGVDAKAMTIISYGKEKPIAEGDDPSSLAKNRRANFVPIRN